LKGADRFGIELQLARAVPEIGKGIVMLQGLKPGTYSVSTGRERQRYQVGDEGTLKVEAVDAEQQMTIVR
jgi:hypothetical protein